MLIDIQSMFKDIIETPQQRRAAMQQEGEQRAQTAVGALSGAGRWAAPLVAQMERQQPERSAAMQRAFGGMLNAIPGIDRETRTESQQLQAVLSEAGTDIQALPARLRQMGYGDQAFALEEKLAEKARVEEDRTLNRQVTEAQLTSIQKAGKREDAAAVAVVSQRNKFRTMVEGSSLSEAKQQALTTNIEGGGFDGKGEELFKILYPDRKDEVIGIGKGVMDLQTNEWIVPPTEIPSMSDLLSAINPDNHDPASVAAFHRAGTDALSLEGDEALNGIADAYKLLKDRTKDGYQWATSYDDNNQAIDAQVPIVGTPDYVAYRREVAGANASAERVIQNSMNAIEVADQILNALETGEASTGIKGITLGLFPGTDEADVVASTDTLLAEMGIAQLEAMRAAAANGASGFGQLTEKELKRLEDRIRSLSRRQSKTQQIANVTEIRDLLARAANSAKTDWTVDEWMGLTPKPFPLAPAQSDPPDPAQDGMTSSGYRFSIKRVGEQ